MTDGSKPPASPRAGSGIDQETMAQALQQGIGGSRGLVDSSVPTAVFLVVYLVSSQQLMPSVWAAVAAAAVVAIIRKSRKEPLQQIIGGLFGVAIAAFLAARTGRAEDFFLPGLLLNLGYGLVFAISALIRMPILGYLAGALVGHPVVWREYPTAKRAAVLASWLWAGMFALRLAVQLPLYFAGAVGALGVAKLVMGWPLFLLVAYMTYRILATEFTAVAESEAAQKEAEPEPEPTGQ